MGLTRTQTGRVSFDPFYDRSSTGTTIGGNWIERSGDWSIADQTFTPPPPNRRLRCSSAVNDRFIEDSTLATTEMFLQCVCHGQAVFFLPGLAGIDWNSGSPNGYGLEVSNVAPGFSLRKFVNGVGSYHGPAGGGVGTDVDRLVQLYINTNTDVQQAHTAGVNVQDTDSVHHGLSLSGAIRSGWWFIASGNNWFSQWLWMRGKVITVTGLPTAFTAQIVNSAGTVMTTIVGPATTTVDVSLYHAVVPAAVDFGGWVLRILNQNGQTIEQYPDGVFPGDVFTFTHTPVFNPAPAYQSEPGPDDSVWRLVLPPRYFPSVDVGSPEMVRRLIERRENTFRARGPIRAPRLRASGEPDYISRALCYGSIPLAEGSDITSWRALPGCCDDVLKFGWEIVLLAGHSIDRVYASTGDGSLQIEVDELGLVIGIISDKLRIAQERWTRELPWTRGAFSGCSVGGQFASHETRDGTYIVAAYDLLEISIGFQGGFRPRDRRTWCLPRDEGLARLAAERGEQERGR